MKKIIVFDLDGTLLNTLDDLFLATNYALEKHKKPLRTKEEVRTFIGNGIKVLIDKASNESTDKDAILETFKAYYLEHSMDHVTIYDGILDLLRVLKKQNYKLAVISNKFDPAVKDICNIYFPSIFDFILGEKPNILKKPHKDMMMECLNYFNEESNIYKLADILYIGDSEVDILFGENANVDTILCSYGYRSKNELIKAGATTIIDTPQEILKFL